MKISMLIGSDGKKMLAGIILIIFFGGCKKLDPVRNVKLFPSWKETVGGSRQDRIAQILQSPDGNFVVLGVTNSEDGLQNTTHGDHDMCVMKFTSDGELIWQYDLGGTNFDEGLAMCHNPDGYTLVGATASNDGDINPDLRYTGPEQQDIWIIVLDEYGKISNQRCLGGSLAEWARSIRKTADDGYILCGASESADFDASENKGGTDFWIVKLNPALEVDWQRSYGGSDYDDAFVILQIADGGYLVAGTTASGDLDIAGNNGALDAWVAKLNSSGNITWSNHLGGSSTDGIYDAVQTDEGNFVLAGYVNSENADAAGYHGGQDGWVIKMSPEGNILWNRAFGGSGQDFFTKVIPTVEGDLLLSGSTASADGDVAFINGESDVWLVKLSENGDLLWEKVLGGSEHDFAWELITTNDDQLMLGANVNSNDGDIIGNHGDVDMWIIKFGYTE